MSIETPGPESYVMIVVSSIHGFFTLLPFDMRKLHYSPMRFGLIILGTPLVSEITPTSVEVYAIITLTSIEGWY